MSGLAANNFTTDDATRVRLSLASLLRDMNGFSQALYNRLFAVAPGVRPMFSGNLDIQREKLVATLSLVAANAPKLSADTQESARSVTEIKQRIRDLGRRHRDLGVQDAHYDVLKGVLIGVLRDRIGAEFDDVTEEAWSRFYDVVAAEMMAK